MAHDDEMRELQAWGLKQGQQGSTSMDPTSIRLMLDGFFRRFKLLPQVSYVLQHKDVKTGDFIWSFVGMRPWYDEPGFPVVPESELAVADTGRLRRIIQTVFRTAAKRDELARLTALRGRELDDVLRAVGA